jgi:hypothetical protein
MTMMTGLDQFQKTGKENLDVAVKSASAFTKGFQALAAETADYSRHTFESGAKAFEKLVAASSLDKAVEVQSDFLRTAYEGYVSQATKVGEIMTAMARDAYKPYEGYFGKMTK